MSKGQDSKKNVKKKPLLTAKEKKAAKHFLVNGKRATGFGSVEYSYLRTAMDFKLLYNV